MTLKMVSNEPKQSEEKKRTPVVVLGSDQYYLNLFEKLQINDLNERAKLAEHNSQIADLLLRSIDFKKELHSYDYILRNIGGNHEQIALKVCKDIKDPFWSSPLAEKWPSVAKLILQGNQPLSGKYIARLIQKHSAHRAELLSLIYQNQVLSNAWSAYLNLLSSQLPDSEMHAHLITANLTQEELLDLARTSLRYARIIYASTLKSKLRYSWLYLAITYNDEKLIDVEAIANITFNALQECAQKTPKLAEYILTLLPINKFNPSELSFIQHKVEQHTVKPINIAEIKNSQDDLKTTTVEVKRNVPTTATPNILLTTIKKATATDADVENLVKAAALTSETLLSVIKQTKSVWFLQIIWRNKTLFPPLQATTWSALFEWAECEALAIAFCNDVNMVQKTKGIFLRCLLDKHKPALLHLLTTPHGKTAFDAQDLFPLIQKHGEDICPLMLANGFSERLHAFASIVLLGQATQPVINTNPTINLANKLLTDCVNDSQALPEAKINAFYTLWKFNQSQPARAWSYCEKLLTFALTDPNILSAADWLEIYNLSCHAEVVARPNNAEIKVDIPLVIQRIQYLVLAMQDINLETAEKAKCHLLHLFDKESATICQNLDYSHWIATLFGIEVCLPELIDYVDNNELNLEGRKTCCYLLWKIFIQQQNAKAAWGFVIKLQELTNNHPQALLADDWIEIYHLSLLTNSAEVSETINRLKYLASAVVAAAKNSIAANDAKSLATLVLKYDLKTVIQTQSSSAESIFNVPNIRYLFDDSNLETYLQLHQTAGFKCFVREDYDRLEQVWLPLLAKTNDLLEDLKPFVKMAKLGSYLIYAPQAELQLYGRLFLILAAVKGNLDAKKTIAKFLWQTTQAPSLVNPIAFIMRPLESAETLDENLQELAYILAFLPYCSPIFAIATQQEMHGLDEDEKPVNFRTPVLAQFASLITQTLSTLSPDFPENIVTTKFLQEKFSELTRQEQESQQMQQAEAETNVEAARQLIQRVKPDKNEETIRQQASSNIVNNKLVSVWQWVKKTANKIGLWIITHPTKLLWLIGTTASCLFLPPVGILAFLTNLGVFGRLLTATVAVTGNLLLAQFNLIQKIGNYLDQHISKNWFVSTIMAVLSGIGTSLLPLLETEIFTAPILADWGLFIIAVGSLALTMTSVLLLAVGHTLVSCYQQYFSPHIDVTQTNMETHSDLHPSTLPPESTAVAVATTTLPKQSHSNATLASAMGFSATTQHPISATLPSSTTSIVTAAPKLG